MNHSDYGVATDQLLALVNLMMENQQTELVKEAQQLISREVFRAEFQTVQVHLPRRMGHTTAIRHLRQQYSCIMAFPTFELAKCFVRECELSLVKMSEHGVFAVNTNDVAHRFANELLAFSQMARPELFIVDNYQTSRYPNYKQWIYEFAELAIDFCPELRGFVFLQ